MPVLSMYTRYTEFAADDDYDDFGVFVGGVLRLCIWLLFLEELTRELLVC